MTDEPESLVLRYLRRLDEKVDLVIDDLKEVKERLGRLEDGYAHLEVGYASLSRRLDRVHDRLDRIETLTHPCRTKRPMSATACAGGSA